MRLAYSNFVSSGLGVRPVLHRPGTVDDHAEPQVRIRLELLDVKAIRAAVGAPVEATQVIARACTRGTLRIRRWSRGGGSYDLPATEPMHRLARYERQPPDLRQSGGIDERSKLSRGSGHRAPLDLGGFFDEALDDVRRLDTFGLGGEGREYAVPQHGGGHGLHVLDAHRKSARHGGARLGAEDQVLDGARPCAP